MLEASSTGQRATTPSRLQAWLLAAVLLAAVGWLGGVVSVAYDFANPVARVELRHDLEFVGDLLTRLPVGFPRALWGAVFVVSALGLGHLALRPLALRFEGAGERALLEVGIGLMVWTWVTLALGSAGILRAGPFRVVLAAGVGAGAWAGLQWAHAVRAQTGESSEPVVASRTTSQGRLVVEAVAWALLAVVLYLALLGALGPEAQFDGRWYHLAQVKHYLQRGTLYNMVAETRIAVAGLPAYHQLLLTGVAAVFDLRVAKLFPWFELLLAVGMLVCIGTRHFGSRLLGVVAALLFTSTPLVSWFATTSANDLAVVLVSLYALHAYLRWRAEPGAGTPWLVVLGALCGYAAGVKPFALSFASLICLAIVADSLVTGGERRSPERRWRAAGIRAAVMAASAVLAVTPWLVRSAMTTGNPTFPFLEGVLFDSPYWNDTVQEHYRWAVGQYGVEQTVEWFVKLPLLTVTRAQNHRALIGPLFLLFLPALIFAAVSARGAGGGLHRRLTLYSCLLVTVWFLVGLHETRYVAFVLPVLALLVAFVLVGFRWTGRVGGVLRVALALIAVAVTILNIKPLVPFHVQGTAPEVAGRTFIPWEYLYRGATEDSVQLDQMPMIQYLNRHLAQGCDKVYDGGGQLVPFYLYSDIELFNGGMWDSPTRMRQWDLSSPDAGEQLARVGVTHVVVRTTKWPRARLRAVPVGRFLQPLWEAPDGQVLYRFDPGT